MIDAFEDFHAEPEELLDLGDQLLATIQYRGHGTGSGVPVNDPDLPALHGCDGAWCVWQQDFSDRSEALEAAGSEASRRCRRRTSTGFSGGRGSV